MQYIIVKSNVHLHGTWLTVPHCPLMCKYKARLSRFGHKYLLLKNSKVPKLEMPSFPWTKHCIWALWQTTLCQEVSACSLLCHIPQLCLFLQPYPWISAEISDGEKNKYFPGVLHKRWAFRWLAQVAVNFFSVFCLSQILQYTLPKLLAWEIRVTKAKDKKNFCSFKQFILVFIPTWVSFLVFFVGK